LTVSMRGLERMDFGNIRGKKNEGKGNMGVGWK
jgi:hypothetical protein